MEFTLEQYKQWVNECFPDNNSRTISEGDIRDGLTKMAEFAYGSGIPLANINKPVENAVAGSATLVEAGSTSVISNYLKVGANTIDNLISPRTGRRFTANKAITKPSGQSITDIDVDNVNYFKDASGSYYRRNWPLGYIDPREFGAKIDGIVNDTIALQSSINAGASINASNSILRAGGLKFKSNSEFRNALIKNYGEISNVDAGAFVLENIDNVTFENIVFDQDISVLPTSVTRACLIKNSTNIRFKNCTFKNWTEQPIRIDSSQNITIESCAFYNCNRGSAATVGANDDYGAIAIFGATCQNINVLNCKMIDGGTGISVFNGSKINITGNFISLNTVNVSGMGCWIVGNVSDITISENYIENSVNEGIVVTNISNDTGNTTYAGKLITINGNKTRNCKYAGISVDVGFENVSITGNICYVSSTCTHGIYLNKISYGVCQANIIVAEGTTTMTDMIFVGLSTGINCDNNIMIGGDVSRRLYQNQNGYSNFTNNKLYVNAGKTGLLIYPGTAVRNRYSGNLIRGAANTSILVDIAAGSSGLVSDSIITDNTFATGSLVKFYRTQRCLMTGNQFFSITTIDILNDLKSIIVNNYGFDYKRADITTSPDFVGELSLVNGNYFIATGTMLVTDWKSLYLTKTVVLDSATLTIPDFTNGVLLSGIGSDQTAVLPSAATHEGREITLINRNASAFIWNLDKTLVTNTSAGMLTISPNNSVITIIARGGSWIVKSHYSGEYYSKSEADLKYGQIIHDTSLNTPQTSSTLNTKYPGANEQTVVIARNVSPGMIYFKQTNTNWIAVQGTII